MRNGYCALTADFLHIGHIRFLKKCREKCDYLVVAIMSDDCVEKYKGKRPLMNQQERMELVGNLRMADEVTIQDSFEFPESVFHMHNIIFDSVEHRRVGSDFVFCRTEGISSTLIKEQDDYFNPSQRPL